MKSAVAETRLSFCPRKASAERMVFGCGAAWSRDVGSAIKIGDEGMERMVGCVVSSSLSKLLPQHDVSSAWHGHG